MKCPICGKVLENGYCNTCKRVIHPLYQHTKKPEDNEIIEAEIVEDDDTSQQKYYHRNSFRQSPFFTQYTFRHNNSLNNSCLIGIISLSLIFFVFLQMGFLAALGFAFFISIGKIITTILFFKNLFEGRILSPLVLDVAVWILSYVLVTWLAS